MTTTTFPTPTTTDQDQRPRLRATPVCDRCHATDSPTGWWAVDDGAQICHHCWLELTVVPVSSDAA